MTQKEIEEILYSYPNVVMDHSIDDDSSVFKIAEDNSTEGKIFAIIIDDSKPLRLCLKCDYNLSKILRERYETVLPCKKMNPKYWNTIILSGQLPIDEIKSLIILSYNLVNEVN